MRRPARGRRHLPDRRRAPGDAAALAALDVRALARRRARRRSSSASRATTTSWARPIPAALRDLDWHYLQDETIEIDGLSVYGSPWTSRFQDWAFMLSEEELARRWARSPRPSTCCACTRRRSATATGSAGSTSARPRCSRRSTTARSEAVRVRARASGLWPLAARRLRRSSTPRYCDMDYLPAHPPVVVGARLACPRRRAARARRGAAETRALAAWAAGACPVTAVTNGPFSSA